MQEVLFFIACTPFLLLLALIFVFKKPLIKAAPITALYTLLLATVVWQMHTPYVLGAVGKGLLLAIDIVLIIFGALLFLNYLKQTGVITSFEFYLGHISQDKRIQAIILIWFFGSFIEGTAGFGTPAAIIAPLLVSIGFRPVIAVATALIGNSTAVAFGALGTPIRIGLSGYSVESISALVGVIGALGVIVPLLILCVIVMVSNVKQKSHRIKEMIPFALWSGACFVIPYLFIAQISPELPSLLGSLIGVCVLGVTTKFGLFVPEHQWKVKEGSMPKRAKHSLGVVLSPYVLLIVLLFVSKQFLGSLSIPLANGLVHNFHFYNPGFIFIITVLVVSLRFKDSLKDSCVSALRIVPVPFVVILCISLFVELMVFSLNNNSGLPGMFALLQGVINILPVEISALLTGAFGAFVSGSATVSVLLFGDIIASAAGAVTLSSLALLVNGAAIGNMISLTNIVAAQATVGITHQEDHILKVVSLPFLAYMGAILLGIIILL